MPEKERHRNLKSELLKWLQADTKSQIGHRMNQVAFHCNDHIHFWRVPPWAVFADAERRMPHPDGKHFQPDVTLLDYSGEAVAVLEVKHTNRNNKVRSAACALGIPYFRFDAPPPVATAHEMWVRQVEEPRIAGAGGFHAWWQGGVSEDGHTVYPSRISVSGNQPGQVVMGAIAWANATNLTHEGAAWLQDNEDGHRWAEYHRDARIDTAQEIGKNLLNEIETCRTNPHWWSAGIGDVQLAGSIGIYPLNKELETGKYLPCDVTDLLHKWAQETAAMNQRLKDLEHRKQSKPCQMFC